jgi:hypothetical protein
LSNARGIPIAFFVGTHDGLATPGNNRWAKAKLDIGNNVVFYKEYELSHLSFLVAKDMSYFTEDVLPVLAKYPPVKAASTFMQ